MICESVLCHVTQLGHMTYSQQFEINVKLHLSWTWSGLALHHKECLKLAIKRKPDTYSNVVSDKGRVENWNF